MPRLNQKGFAQLLVLLLILGGIATGTYLIQQKTNLFPKASENKNENQYSYKVTKEKIKDAKVATAKAAKNATTTKRLIIKVRYSKDAQSKKGYSQQAEQSLLNLKQSIDDADSKITIAQATTLQYQNNLPLSNKNNKSKEQKIKKTAQLLNTAKDYIIIAKSSVSEIPNEIHKSLLTKIINFITDQTIITKIYAKEGQPDKNGNTYTTNPDGSVTVTHPDGTEETHPPKEPLNLPPVPETPIIQQKEPPPPSEKTEEATSQAAAAASDADQQAGEISAQESLDGTENQGIDNPGQNTGTEGQDQGPAGGN